MNTESTFTEYDMYYDTPELVSGQPVVIGRHYVTEDIWLPILLVSPTEDNRTKEGRELAQLVRDFDEECDRVHHANEQYRKYGRA